MNQERKIETETVDAVAKPQRAKVEDATGTPARAPIMAPSPHEAEELGEGNVRETFERKRDYLEGFLSAKPPEPSADEPGSDLQAAIVEAIKEIYDPEIPVNIYDLGLIYDVSVTDDGHATVKMTLTTPHCPVAESMPAEVELRVGAVPGVGIADVELVWDPPWDPQKMSDEAKLELGML